MEHITDMKTLVGNLALVCTIASYFAGAQVCRMFVKRGTTSQISALPFISGALCTSLWLRYGFYIDDTILITVNAIGTVLQSSYILIFFYFTIEKKMLYKQLAVFTSVLVVLFAYSIYGAKDEAAAARIMGLAACTASLLACASPMVSLSEVLKTKSVENVPFSIILASFIVTSLWCTYGYLLQDQFVQVPNMIGASLSGFQLCLFVFYSQNQTKKSNTE